MKDHQPTNLTNFFLTVTVKESVQAPPAASVVSWEAVDVKHSKSRRKKHTSKVKDMFALLHMHE